MPSKPLRKPHGSAPAGAQRRGHRARFTSLSPGTSVTGAAHFTPTHSPVVLRDPQTEDQYYRTSVRVPSYSESEAVTECAFQLRKIGDKLNLQQKILNLIAKLFCPGSGECLE